MTMRLWILTRKELRDAFRNRWFLMYAVSFALLSLAFSSAALLGSGYYGFANFGRTAASLINLVLLVVPLMGLVAGAQSIAAERERGTLAYVLAQPVSRVEVFLGKFLGQALALGGAIVGGFGISALVLALRGSGGEIGALLCLVGLAVLLSCASLSVGMLISTLTRSSAAALGSAIFLWLGLAFAGDLALIGAAMMTKLGMNTVFALNLLNPLSVYRMAAVLSLRSSLEILGPAGLYAVRTYGAMLFPFFVLALGMWVVLPLGGALRLFARRDAI